MNNKKIIVTGAAGFIGSHLVDKLLELNFEVIGIDNFDSFYDENIKLQNISAHLTHSKYKLIRADVRSILELNIDPSYGIVIHLAAKAGVFPSMNDPLSYLSNNVYGMSKMVDFAIKNNVKKFILASSSSVYGTNPNTPWLESYNLSPISPYAVSKMSSEYLGEILHRNSSCQFIGLRFFTVYGPRQRPDLAIQKFLVAAIRHQPISIYGDGTSQRDYTYIDDIIDGILSAIYLESDKSDIINLGNDTPIQMNELLSAISQITRQKLILKYLEPIKGDVDSTHANIAKAKKILNYNPRTDLLQGLLRQYEWILSHG